MCTINLLMAGPTSKLLVDSRIEWSRAQQMYPGDLSRGFLELAVDQALPSPTIDPTWSPLEWVLCQLAADPIPMGG